MATTNVKATPAKTAQAAPKAAESKPEATKAVALDFGSLVLEDAPDEALKRSRQTILDRSPVLDWLRASFQSGKGKAVTVPADQADGLERLLRSGADRLTSENKDGERVGVAVTQTPVEGGNVRVAFLAKPRRKYTERKGNKTAETA